METTRELSYGERAVGLTFNPSNDADVQNAKELYAKIIDLAYNLKFPNDGSTIVSEKARLLSVAITEAQAAQMWIVKAITWKD